MSKKKSEEEVFVGRCDKILSYWQELLGLNNWSLMLVFNSQLAPDVAMQVDWSPHYKRAVIAIDPDCLTKEEYKDDEFLEDYLVHELAHILLAPITNIHDNELADDGNLAIALNKACETVCEDLKAILMRMK